MVEVAGPGAPAFAPGRDYVFILDVGRGARRIIAVSDLPIGTDSYVSLYRASLPLGVALSPKRDLGFTDVSLVFRVALPPQATILLIEPAS